MPQHQWTWTKPYCGVSHLNFEGRRRVQFTISEYDRFVEAFWLDLGSNHPFTAVEEKTFFHKDGDAVEKAKSWLESVANTFYGRD